MICMDIIVLSHSSQTVPNVLDFALPGALCLLSKAIAKGTDAKLNRSGFSHMFMLPLAL